MADAMRIDTITFSGVMPPPNISILTVIGFYAVVSLLGLITGRITRATSYIIDSILLILFLWITGPLVGFAIYFALWHSAGHINEMREFFESRGKSLSVGRFYAKALPFTIVSIIGLVLLFFVNVQLNLDNQFISLMFILISVLTLPHMLIVERMYEEKAA
jgi:Brp/Blh family beta-carotene 15,15'-monooxygenase